MLIKSHLVATMLAFMSFLLCSNAAAEGLAKKEITGYDNIVVDDAMPHIKFDEDRPLFSDGFFDQLRAKINSLGEYRNLKIEVVGHSDSSRLGAASRARWGSNLGLSKTRATNAVEQIRGRLNIPGVEFTSRGVGASQPLVANDSPENKEKNRRGETNFSYDKPIYKTVEAIDVEQPKVSSVPTGSVSTPTPVAAKSQKSADDLVRDSLAVSDEDEDENTLEEALTAVDQNYSLIKKGGFGLNYGHSFTYSSSDSILLSTSGVPLDVSRDSRYTHSTNLSVSYGLKNNLTLSASIPFVSTVRAGSTTQDRVEDDGIGDVSLSLRWQPWPTRLGKVNTSLSSSITLPTGTDPYEIDTENSLATGSGNYSLSLGLNLNKTIDPIIAYGGISVGKAFDQTGLNQKRGDRFLQAVRPRLSFSYSMGIGYALSYGVSINTGFQHSFGSRTLLEFSDQSSAVATARTSTFESIGGHSAMYTVSAGFRTAPGTVLSVSLGIGLTREAPDFTIGFSLPFSVDGFKSYFQE